MNDLQKKELELLKIFIEICDKLDLTYFLVCGSALGAVKYGGFIPWDDDIDVALPREDYRKFCSYAQGMLPDNLFLQNYKTDPFYPLFMSKLRNSDTTFIETIYSEINMNHGVYIDIFPLDGYPKKLREQEELEKEKSRYMRRRLVRCKFNRFSKENIKHVKNIFLYVFFNMINLFSNTQKVIARFEKYASKYKCDDSDIWCNHGNWQGVLEYAERKQYGQGTKALFEGIEVIIPELYDDYLTQKYGDWKKDPPKLKQKSHHDYLLIDLSCSYKKYIKHITKKGKIILK